MKVICPKCGNLIELSKDDKIGFCNECGNNFNPEEGKRMLQKKYKVLQTEAYKCTYTKGNYEEAIDYYKECLIIKPNDFSSIVGICLNTVNGNSFDNVVFNQVEKIIDEYDISLNNENTFIYLNFIKDLLSQISFYIAEAHERLIKDDEFISEKYKTNYLSGINDALTLTNFLKSNIELCVEEEVEEFEKEEHLNELIENTLKNLEEELKLSSLKIKENEETLENPSVVIVDFSGQTKLSYLMYAGIADLVLALIIIIFAATTKNNFVYIGLLVPAIVGLVLYFLYKKYKKE